MKYFIVGDVHGCLNTLKALMKYWQDEQLIFVGDLIDRGNYGLETVEYVKDLVLNKKAILLLGNHEKELIDYYEQGKNFNWLIQGGLKTLKAYEQSHICLETHYEFFKSLPLKYENDYLLVSHAGIACDQPYDLMSDRSIIWNRDDLYDIGKVQVVGHTPLEKVVYKEESHSWYIDTGAVYGRQLTALILDNHGTYIKHIGIATSEVDIK